MGLAPLVVSELYDVVKRIAADDVSILVVEQFAHEVLDVADVAAIILHGAHPVRGLAAGGGRRPPGRLPRRHHLHLTARWCTECATSPGARGASYAAAPIPDDPSDWRVVRIFPGEQAMKRMRWVALGVAVMIGVAALVRHGRRAVEQREAQGDRRRDHRRRDPHRGHRRRRQPDRAQPVQGVDPTRSKGVAKYLNSKAGGGGSGRAQGRGRLLRLEAERQRDHQRRDPGL